MKNYAFITTKKAALVLLLMSWGLITRSQQIVYTISASRNDQTTHLDSILFENLDNQTRFVVGNLPPLPAYDIDLSLQRLVTSINPPDISLEKNFVLVKNIPGAVGVQYTGNTLEHVRITVYNMAGQTRFSSIIPKINPQEVVTVNIPASGMYVLSIDARSGSIHYPALGSANRPSETHRFSASLQAGPDVHASANETILKSAFPDNDFSYQLGDSIRVTPFLNGYYASPHESKITGSLRVHFDMQICCKNDTFGVFTDTRDGQTYKWIRIGDQVWMAENLNYQVNGSYCYMGNTFHCNDYGSLYTWSAAMKGASSGSANPGGVKDVCPQGWHLPDDTEWTQLTDYVTTLGYPNEPDDLHGAGNALKSCRQEDSPLGGDCSTSEHPRWESHSTHHGFDAFGFSALPGGTRFVLGFKIDPPHKDMLGRGGRWWSATQGSPTGAYNHRIYRFSGEVNRTHSDTSIAISVRCVRDSLYRTTYKLNLKANPENAGTVCCAYRFEANEQVSISAACNSGWQFTKWTGDTDFLDDPFAANTTVTMPAYDISLTANFTEREIVYGNGVTDIDGNEYNTVVIGDQEWMAENLRVTRYNNGDAIITGLSDTAWKDTTDGSYTVYSHNDSDGINADAEMAEAYGKLYNWFAVADSRGLCPAGWHVPGIDEWRQLKNFVESQAYPNEYGNPIGAGNALKSCRQENSPLGGDCNTSEHPRWDSDDTHHGFDAFGFSALPGGGRRANGDFGNLGEDGNWWTSTEHSSVTNAWSVNIGSNNGSVYFSTYRVKPVGYSVRCVRDVD